MSNYESQTDPRMRNGWAEYQRLVLAELERHNTLINEINRNLNEINLRIELIKQEQQQIRDLQKQVSDLKDRLSAQETGDKVSEALGRYKKWIIGVIVTFVISAVLPIITIILKVKGVG